MERKYKRYQMKVPIYISLKGGVYKKMIGIECRDISGGGLSFETDRKLPIKAESRVVVSQLGDMPESARIEGRVVHRSKHPTTGRYWVGVEFTEFVNITREELLEQLEDWKSQGPS
jgi:c-di-GMP-binding flagellar brake protein YcgR